MRLHLYFGRRFLKTFLGMLGIFGAIYVLIDMVEQIRRFDTDAISFVQILELTFLSMPGGIYQILPLIVILATLAMFLGLSRSSELVVTRAAGRSALRSLIAPTIGALLIGGLAVALLNPIVAATSTQYERLASNYRGGTGSILSISREGLWLRQGDAEGQIVIRAARANLDGTQLFGATFIGFDRDGGPIYRIEAGSAELVPGAWELTNVKEWPLTGTQNPERTARSLDTLRIPSNLTVNQIRDSFGTPSSIPIWELPAFIERLDRAGFSARAHRVWFQMELAMPLLLVAMVLIGAGFTMRHARFGRTGVMILLAVMTGFTIYFIRNFAQVLGENGNIPVALAAWGPPVAAILMTLGLLLHLEDG